MTSDLHSYTIAIAPIQKKGGSVMDITAKELANYILRLIKEKRLDPDARVSTAEGFAVWKQNILIREDGTRLIL